MADCKGTTRKGKPCHAGAERGYETCPSHRNQEGQPRLLRKLRIVETRVCYGCKNREQCSPAQLTDQSWDWLCVDLCIGMRINRQEFEQPSFESLAGDLTGSR